MEAVILEIVGKLPAGKSASSEEIARAADSERWQRLTGLVRATAGGVARQGRITVLRHNKPADPDTFKGVYRLRLPTEDERAAALARAAEAPVVETPEEGEA